MKKLHRFVFNPCYTVGQYNSFSHFSDKGFDDITRIQETSFRNVCQASYSLSSWWYCISQEMWSVTFLIFGMLLWRNLKSYTTGYKAVIFGHDPVCSAPLEWQISANVAMLKEGPNQPFYHVLVDIRDNSNGISAYVPQEDLQLKRSSDPVFHPWISRVRLIPTYLLYFVGL